MGGVCTSDENPTHTRATPGCPPLPACLTPRNSSPGAARVGWLCASVSQHAALHEGVPSMPATDGDMRCSAASPMWAPSTRLQRLLCW